MAPLALALAGSADAIHITGASLEKGAPGGPYSAFNPCTQNPLIGEEIRLVLDLVSDTGQLSYSCVDDGDIAIVPGCLTGHLPQVPLCPGNLPTDIYGWYHVYPDLPYLGNPLFPDNPNGPIEFVSADDLPFTTTKGETATVEWKYLVSNEGSFNMNLWATRQFDPDDFWVYGYCTDPKAQYSFTEGTRDQNLLLEGASYSCTFCITSDFLPCPITTKSPLEASVVTYVVGTGGSTRPPGVAYIEDQIKVEMTVTNTGIIDLSAIGGKVCAVPRMGNDTQLCATGWDPVGACSDGTSPGSPALPHLIAKAGSAGDSATFSWTFTINGNGCTHGQPGSGTLFYDTVVLGKWAESASLLIGPAPLTFTVTVWVDPDGAAAGYNYMPLGTDPMDPTWAAYLYYMADERVQVRLTISNPSPVESFDLHPKIRMQDSLGATSYELLGYSATGTSVGPSGSQSFTWTYERNMSYLGTCKLFAYNLSFTLWDRGIITTQGVRLLQSPFDPSPACNCPTWGICGVTVKAPDYGFWWQNWNVLVKARNSGNRPVTVGPPACVTLYVSSLGPEAILVSGPAPVDDLPQTWAAGETKNFTWTFSSTGLGSNPDQVCFEAGVAWPTGTFPCVFAGSEQLDRCSTNNKTPPASDVVGCTATLQEPDLYIASFDYKGPPIGVANDESYPIEICLVNKGLMPVTIDKFCDQPTTPIQDISGSRPWGSIITKAYAPNPPVPLVVAPSSSVYVTWNIEAGNCGTGVLFGCSGYPMVTGTPGVSLTGVTGNAADFTIPISFNATDPPLLFTDKTEYSGGQKIYVSITVTNQGQNDMLAFSQTLTAVMNPPGCAVLVKKTPVTDPATLAGTGGACPNAPWYGQAETFVYEFDAVSYGRICFTASMGGTDSVSGITKSALTNTICVRIAKPAVLDIESWSTPLVTMSRTCPGCPLTSDCPTKGENCISVVLKASNKGEISLINAQPVADVDVKPCPTDPAECPGSQATTGAADQLGYTPNVDVPQTISEGSNRMYTWTFSPTGLGCVRFYVQMYGKDAATGVDWVKVDYTGCTDIVDRLPVQVTLKDVADTVIPGQEFTVTIEVYNPGTTDVTLNGGEPALVFVDPATGASLTEKFDVKLPTPLQVKSGERITVTVKVTALATAPVGMVEIRIPQSTMYAANDSETGYRVSVVGSGAALVVEVVPARTIAETPVPNPFRPYRDLKTTLTYSLAVGGRVQLKVYTLSGEMVRTLIDEDRPLGLWSVEWDGKNSRNQVCASGIYLLRFEGPTREGRRYSEVRKLAIIK